ncbi:MAG: AsmA family protein [Methylococcaceae bacterium]
MGKPLKFMLSSIAAFFLLLIAAVCILPFVIDLNDFKPEIAAAVKGKTGRDMVLEGQLKLSLFPWIGVSTGQLALSNASGFQNPQFASVEASEIKVLLLPLLEKKLEINSIVLKGLVLNLAKDKQGITNWDDLSGAGETKAATPTATVDGKQNQQAALAAFAIGGIAIENARINWDDLEAGQHVELTDLKLNIDTFTVGQPVGIAITLNASDSKTAALYVIKLNTELNINQQFDFFSLHHSDLQITTTGENIPGKSLTTALTIADAALDMNQQTAKISGLQLKSGEITLSAELTGSSIKDKPSFQGPVTIAQFSPANVMRQLSIKLPIMRDASALSKLALNFDLIGTSDSVDLQKLAMSLDDSLIKGSVGIHFKQDKNTLPAVRFELNIDALALDRYLPPADLSSKPIASPAVVLAAGFSAFPVETLRKLDAEGAVSLGKLKTYDLSMQDIHLQVNAKGGVVTTKQSIKGFYQGSYVGDLRIDNKGDKSALALNEKIADLQIEPLLKDYRGSAKISGIVDASAQLQGQGLKTDELKASLNGKLNFLVKDSVIKGFNLQKIIDEGKALIKGSALPADPKRDQTLFSDISGTATITNGLLQNNDLLATSSTLHVDGKGSLNLNSEALDYKIAAKLLNRDASAPEPVKGAVAIDIAGTLDQPSYTIDITSLLTDQNKVKIEKLIDKLDKKLGSGVGDLLKSFLR